MIKTNSHFAGTAPRPKSGWRWPALLALTAAALFGARPAEAAAHITGLSIGAQAQVVCAGSTTSATYTVTVTHTGSGTDTSNLTITVPVSGLSGVTSFTPTSVANATASFTLTLITTGAIPQSTAFTLHADNNSTNSTGGLYTVNTISANAGPDQTVCATTATLAGNTVFGGAGSWSVFSGPGSVTTPTSPTSGVTGQIGRAHV